MHLRMVLLVMITSNTLSFRLDDLSRSSCWSVRGDLDMSREGLKVS